MTASSTLNVLILLLIPYLQTTDGLQQQWVRKGRLKPLYGAMSDPDITVSDSIGELTTLGDAAPFEDQDFIDVGNLQYQEDSALDASSLEPILPLNATAPAKAMQTRQSSAQQLSRRKWLQLGALTTGGAITAAFVSTIVQPGQGSNKIASLWTTPHSRKVPVAQPLPSAKKQLKRVNITDVVRETNINVTMECTTTYVSLDRYTFEKKATLKVPGWVPSFLVPPARTIRKISDSELLVAAIVAGSMVEMARTSLLYPLLTLKNRIQADIKKGTRTRMKWGKTKRLHIKRRANILKWNAIRHFREGKLYAGLIPSLLVTVPATGVYFGVRDIARRSLNSVPGLGDVTTAVSAALVADVVALIISTPADALAVRLQVATGKKKRNKNETKEENEEAVRKQVGIWFRESLERLPAVALTDLPYLLSRVALNRYLLHGSVDLAHYELTTIATALLCAVLTTPFDVARTRILVDSDDDPTNGIDGGSGMGLITTMRTIVKEGDGGVANLFAGWLERTVYLAIGRAWLEPLQILGYIAVRDAILLQWFD
ncbi:hypothetical protein MPSEU_000713700 [Mayamaea pseudoterrestris]|nr:hypothetical protein MPSEU_000713700 [Mayamaea pseudoterrestris]